RSVFTANCLSHRAKTATPHALSPDIPATTWHPAAALVPQTTVSGNDGGGIRAACYRPRAASQPPQRPQFAQRRRVARRHLGKLRVGADIVGVAPGARAF